MFGQNAPFGVYRQGFMPGIRQQPINWRFLYFEVVLIKGQGQSHKYFYQTAGTQFWRGALGPSQNLARLLNAPDGI